MALICLLRIKRAGSAAGSDPTRSDNPDGKPYANDVSSEASRQAPGQSRGGRTEEELPDANPSGRLVSELLPGIAAF
jgi:hypothetical protein